MRLKNYLNETTKSPIKKVESFLRSRIDVLYKSFEKKNFNLNYDEVIKILNKVMKSKPKIVFSKGNNKRISKYIDSGRVLHKDGKIERIEIQIRKTALDFLKRFVDGKNRQNFFDIQRNEFLRELLDILSHEHIHLDQLRKSKGWSPYNTKEVEKLQKAKEHDTSLIGYFSNKDEIEAFAHDAAVELIRIGKSKTIDNIWNSMINVSVNYIETEKPKQRKIREETLKRFYKKLVYYLETLQKEKSVKSFTSTVPNLRNIIQYIK